MKPDISPAETPVVESSYGGSLDGDYAAQKSTKGVQLTADEVTEIALGTIDEEFTIESENSPFPEVRANVPNTDNVDLPVNTVRMWFLGIVFTMVCLRPKNRGKFQLTEISWDLGSTSSSQCDIRVSRSPRWWHNCSAFHSDAFSPTYYQ